MLFRSICGALPGRTAGSQLDRPVDLIEAGYDVAIRVNSRPDETLVGKRFLRDEPSIAAAPACVRPARRVLDTAREDQKWRVRNRQREWTLAPEIVLRLGTLTMTRDAVVAGGTEATFDFGEQNACRFWLARIFDS